MSANTVNVFSGAAFPKSKAIDNIKSTMSATEAEQAPDLPLTDNKPVGGVKSGKPFSSRKGNYPIKSIKFWYTEERLVAVEISWYFDDSTETHGDASEATQSKLLSLQLHETVESASIWKTTEGNAVAYVEIQTNGIQYFSAGSKPHTSPVKEDVGNGYLVALAGTVDGKVLSSLSFLFLSNKIQLNQSFGNLVFHSPPRIEDIRAAVAYEQDYWNHSDAPITWSFERNKTYESTQEWKKSSTEEFGAEASISGGFLGIEVGASTSWSISETQEHGRSWSSSETYVWNISGTLAPGKGVRVTAYTIEGTCSLSFSFSQQDSWCEVIDGVIHCYWGWREVGSQGRYKGGLFSKGEVKVINLENN